ncbi:MAG: cation:proton antiporter [Pseudolabrys sp.]|nr:cation:proton antiporter [Pseudolabrys sp.]
MTGASTFTEIAMLLALAAGLGIVGLLLRQPLIVAFIATGIIAGGDVLGIVRSADHINVLAEIGIATLLFLVGLKLDVQIIRNLGLVSVATGLGQVGFTAAVGFVICLVLGLDAMTSAYVAVALTFSSTIIIVKLLSDKRELDSLHGRIALGFLIVQDIAVVVAMVALSALGVGAGEKPAGLGVLGVLASAMLMIGFVVLFIRYGAEPLLRRVARVPELLVTFALAWAVMFAAIGDWIGFGKELGGLLAGVSLASTSVREAVSTRLSSVRDFLLLFFFVGLGARLDLGVLGAQIPAALVLSLFVLIGNPLIVMAIMGGMGYRKRTGFLAGLTVAQISEFSLIFMAMGLTLNHVNPEAMGLVTLIGLVTITLSTYMILYSHQIYRVLEPYLGVFERHVPTRELSEDKGEAHERYDVILFGLGRYGQEMRRHLKTRGLSVLAVDFDPEVVRRLRQRDFPALYGDATDPEFAATLPLDAGWVIIAIPPMTPGVAHEDARLGLIDGLRQANYRGRIAVRCQDGLDTRRFKQAKVDMCLSPFSDAAERAVEMLVAFPDRKSGEAKPKEAAAPKLSS